MIKRAALSRSFSRACYYVPNIDHSFSGVILIRKSSIDYWLKSLNSRCIPPMRVYFRKPALNCFIAIICEKVNFPIFHWILNLDMLLKPTKFLDILLIVWQLFEYMSPCLRLCLKFVHDIVSFYAITATFHIFVTFS